MALSDSMGFSFSRSWCLVDRSYDRGWDEQGLRLEAVLDEWRRMLFTEDGSRRAVINRCNQPPPTALTH